MAGLEDEGEARERGEREQEPEVGGLQRLHANHRMPAPVVSAIAPSIMRANDSRARIVFTDLPFEMRTPDLVSATGRSPCGRRSLALRPRLATGLPLS